jgi:predicted Zn-dependent peptidase
MEKITFEQLQEELYFEELDNGLKVYILPKKGFNKTFCTFTTNYGSIDNMFVPLNGSEYKKVPDGIAHFLEHKLFEKKELQLMRLLLSRELLIYFLAHKMWKTI